MLSHALPPSDSRRLDAVNSTHWAVASTNDRNELIPNQTERNKPNTDSTKKDPHKLLEVSATAPGGYGPTVEAFESRYGAPVMGLQWHPETYLPGMLGHDSATDAQRESSKNIFHHFAQASETYRKRKTMVSEMKERQPLITRIHECQALFEQGQNVDGLFHEITEEIQRDGIQNRYVLKSVEELKKKIQSKK